MKDIRDAIYDNMVDIAPFNFTEHQKPYIKEAMQRYADHCMYEKCKVNGLDKSTDVALNMQNVTNRFSLKEIENVMRKAKKAKIKSNFKDILQKATGDSYNTKDDESFLIRYTGAEVNVYEWCGDWWICEDDNYVITEDCFELI